MPGTPASSKSLLLARTGLRRVGIIGAVTAATLLLFAGPALAHITVTPGSVVAGSTDVLTFHVPNEEAKADAVKLDVQIPTDHPIAQLLVEPPPGWTVSVKTTALAKPLVTDDGKFTQAVSEVIWSGGKIAPGQFQDFSISADPMPTGESQVAFKAIQTYSNGDIVRWIDLKQPGQPAPEHPAPVVTLTAGTTTATAAGKTTTTTASAGSNSDGLARVLAIAGLLLAVLASLLTLTVVRQARRLATGITAPVDPSSQSATASAKAQPIQPQAAKTQPAKTGAKTTERREPVSASAKSTAKRGQSPPRRRG